MMHPRAVGVTLVAVVAIGCSSSRASNQPHARRGALLPVLQELRDTPAASGRLLDEVDAITSVSGGSFTSAY